MREILFRGKRLDNGEWVDGFYVCLHDHKGNESHRIYTGYAETDCGDYYPEWFEVDPSTVGQFTGLLDKNGKRIFEGDVVQSDGYGPRSVVKFCLEDVASCGCCYPSFVGSGFKAAGCYLDSCKVIGNIHDNPELLEVTPDE